MALLGAIVLKLVLAQACAALLIAAGALLLRVLR